MKVGVDAVMLGAWAPGPSNPQRILDIGTGTGVIALMLAQRFAGAEISAVDIHPTAADMAASNASKSPWANRISVVCGDIASVKDTFGAQFDVITCNPPYFSRGFPVSDADRKTARDAAALPHPVLASVISDLLSDEGSASVILPIQEGALFVERMRARNLFVHKHTLVMTREGKPPKRSLLAFGKKEITPVQDTLIIHDASGQYTSAYRTLTGEFYLAF